MTFPTNQTEMFFIQTIHPPFDEIGFVEAHYKLVSQNAQWADVGILIDQNAGEQKTALITLIEKDRVILVFRICLSTPKETLEAIRLFTEDKNRPILLRACQGEFFTTQQIQSLEELNHLWGISQAQALSLDASTELEYIERIFFKPRIKGRGKAFRTETIREVYMDSHGRCMFEGCGANLLTDETTGYDGNYSYLAHNVASSENGPRGIKAISEELSDEASNILLLCDKHHRLVDKIAASDYPAHRLSKMRADFCNTATRLLNGLSYEPVPAISISWPVQRNVISPPSPLQINQSMAKLNWRMDSTLLSPCGDNDGTLKNLSPDQLNQLWPQLIENASEKVLSSLGRNQYRAALFAFGLMPQLIALGAKIGNKQEIIPMLRYRDGNQWTWPADTPNGEAYEIIGLENLDKDEGEIILTLSFTQHPHVFEDFTDEKQIKKIAVKAHEMGNGALGHPKDGIKFMADMQGLLHELKNSYGVKKIHILPCASNAVCVFFGKAFDIHHPELILYDFCNGTMEPILHIGNNNALCQIKSACIN